MTDDRCLLITTLIFTYFSLFQDSVITQRASNSRIIDYGLLESFCRFVL